MLEEYRKHVAERAAVGIVAKPLDATQMAALVELLKNPPAGEEEFLTDLLVNRVPPGVDEAAYVKAGCFSREPSASTAGRSPAQRPGPGRSACSASSSGTSAQGGAPRPSVPDTLSFPV